MAKNINRSQLRQLTKDLGLYNGLTHDALMRLLDTAQEQADPEEYLRGLAREQRGTPREGEAPAEPNEATTPDNGQAATDRIMEVLQEGATDPAILAAPPRTVTFDHSKNPPQLPADFYLHLPNLATVSCPPAGYQTRKVDVTLTGFPLARLALTRLRHHLDETHARCSNGRHVESAPRALIWLLEAYGRACGLEVPPPEPQATNAEKETVAAG